MKLTLGITFTLLLILQTFQQVSADIPKEWERGGPNQSSSELTVQPMEDNTTPSSSEDRGEAEGSNLFSSGDEQPQNSTELDQIPEKSSNETEEASSEGPDATTPPPMIALNSSSEISNTSAESNETQTHETPTNSTTAEPEHHQPTLNDTKPEANTTESNSDDSGSGFDDLPANSTTKSPTTTTKDVNITTAGQTEPPLHPTTTLPPAVPEDNTKVVPESGDMTEDPTGQIENRENSGRGSGPNPVQDVSENKTKAWVVVLVVGIAVGVIALTAFIVLNRKNRRDFSHRKLVEETSPDPVLRLDNSEPLDLKFDGFGYSNPGLEADNIQMTNFPQGRSK